MYHLKHGLVEFAKLANCCFVVTSRNFRQNHMTLQHHITTSLADFSTFFLNFLIVNNISGVLKMSSLCSCRAVDWVICICWERRKSLCSWLSSRVVRHFSVSISARIAQLGVAGKSQ